MEKIITTQDPPKPVDLTDPDQVVRALVGALQRTASALNTLSGASSLENGQSFSAIIEAQKAILDAQCATVAALASLVFSTGRRVTLAPPGLKLRQ